jgi:cytochrome P450
MFLKKAPVVKGVFFFGHALEFGRDPLNFLLKLQNDYERIAQIRIVYLKVNLLVNAEDIKYVLQENSKSFVKGRAYRVLGQVLGNGILTSHGEFWHRQRKLAQPAFYKQRLALLVDIMNDETMTMIKRWEATLQQENGSTILPMTKEMMKTTLLIVTKSLFGTGIDPNKIAHISRY